MLEILTPEELQKDTDEYRRKYYEEQARVEELQVRKMRTNEQDISREKRGPGRLA